MQYLATSGYTLASVKANVRQQSGTLSVQDSQIIDPQMNDIIHNSVLLVRSIMGRSIDEFYLMNSPLHAITMTNGFGSSSISSISIANLRGITIRDSSLGVIPVLSHRDFNHISSLYTPTEMGTKGAIATVETLESSPVVLSIEFYSGANTISNPRLYYSRNPYKITTDTDTIDIPDYLVPIVQDSATVSVFRLLVKTPPVEIENRVKEFIGSQLKQV